MFRFVFPLLGPSSGIFGDIWAVLGGSEAVLGPSWAVLGPSWGPLGPSWSGLSWAVLERRKAAKARRPKTSKNKLEINELCLS